MSLKKLICQRAVHFFTEAYLVEISLEAIFFKQFPVPGRIVVHAVQRRMKSIYKQPPPLIALAEVDGAIHSLHAPVLQPLLAMVKHEPGRLAAVDTLKETDAAC